MSYRKQLESVFTPTELEVLEYLVNNESSTDTSSDTIHNMSATDKRALKSIRDKLSGKPNIGNPQTTRPSKL